MFIEFINVSGNMISFSISFRFFSQPPKLKICHLHISDRSIYIQSLFCWDNVFTGALDVIPFKKSRYNACTGSSRTNTQIFYHLAFSPIFQLFSGIFHCRKQGGLCIYGFSFVFCLQDCNCIFIWSRYKVLKLPLYPHFC